MLTLECSDLSSNVPINLDFSVLLNVQLNVYLYTYIFKKRNIGNSVLYLFSEYE